MNYYVIQVLTGGEDKFLKLARRALDSINPPLTETTTLMWPRRRLRIRKSGKDRDVLAPIFPGYLFLESEELSTELYWALKEITGFCKFLKDNNTIEPLTGGDRQLLLHFLSFGEVVEKSRAYFDENRRIRIADGALKGLEGRIIKVDRRKGRARVALSLYEDSFKIDFGFELLEPVGENENNQE